MIDHVGDHVEDRSRVRRAAREVGEGERRELRRAERLRHRELTAGGGDRAHAGGRQRRRVAHEQRGGDHDEPHEIADDQHGEAPVVAGDEPASERSHHGRADAEPGRDERDGKAAMPREPARRRRGHRCVEAARRQPDQHAEQELELAEGGRPARRHQAETEQRAARQHDRARAEPVGECAPEERARPHAEPVDQRRRRDARAGPAHRLGHRRQEYGERQHRAHADARDDDPHRDDDPAVEELHDAERSRSSKSGCGRPVSSMTGRTSTVPRRAMGIRAATAMASSRSLASIRK